MVIVILHVAMGGLSPRLRGNPHGCQNGVPAHGSIPAPAGEPHQDDAKEVANKVYPRACGGTVLPGVDDRLTVGLSPRLRGNHL